MREKVSQDGFRVNLINRGVNAQCVDSRVGYERTRGLGGVCAGLRSEGERRFAGDTRARAGSTRARTGPEELSVMVVARLQIQLKYGMAFTTGKWLLSSTRLVR